jgi:polysaccharide pyruvyl transferase WcaK-like protein
LLKKEFPHVILAPRFTSPSEAKTYIAGMDFFMGARMHACIAAFSSGVPVIPMAYSRKFEGLFGSLGYPHVVDCTTEQNAQILEKIAVAFGQRSALEQEARDAMVRGTAKLALYRAALKALIMAEAARHG